ncbi:hypothetical protein [uncultured Megasphaera sp.]|uniref:hypothetical protein n=1 Tax=uncultured Megasphaera sp. TaxID=165188 RepID=UPI0026598404|nr:hypothetical protein [uncultured Megasphaera sp.]
MNVKRKVAAQEDAVTYEIGDIESGDVATAGAVDSARETTIPRAEDRLDSTGLAHLIDLLDARFAKQLQCHFLQRNKAYAVGDIAYSPNLPSWAYLECKTAGTTGTSEPDFTDVSTTGGALTVFIKRDGSVVWLLRDKRCRYQLGQLVSLITTPNAYDYLLLCDGSAVDTEKYPLLDGVFPNNTLPQLTDGRFLEGGTVADKGKTRAPGLPNITGAFSAAQAVAWNDSTNGCFYTDGTLATSPASAKPENHRIHMNLDASRSNPIYGASTTVQPKSLVVNYYINYGG